MDSQTLDPSLISSATISSSWSILRGSLDNSVTFESSISCADSESDHTVAVNPKNPLILRRPSPDSGPCEITVHLVHQHEIRQVYVQSTARVYEIYCAADEKGGNEYLCTVRCGLAAHSAKPVQVTDTIGPITASNSGANRCGEEGHSRTQSGGSINEDDWVNVDPSGFNGGDRSLSSKNESCTEKGKQDLFEATAEISDADPVMSVTLRLLSIQSGDYIYIDEVYIYADPTISEDTASSSNMPENSSGSALMSMLVPTLLQLSNSRMSQKQQRNDSAMTDRSKSLDAEHKSTSAHITSSTFSSGQMPSSEIHGASEYMAQPQVPVETPDSQSRPYSTTGRENGFSCSRIERTLDELVSRISRIELFCLRFEENMLKPISSMEARLEKVEQQLELFFKNPESRRAECNRNSAPEFSCNDPESISACIDGTNRHACTKLDLMKTDDGCHAQILVPCSEASSPANVLRHSDMLDVVKNDDCCHEEVSVQPSETSPVANVVRPSNVPSSASASQLHPSLVVTAPDFSSIDDEEENDMIEAVKDSPIDSSKKPLSIDDALASALAEFLSSASTDPSTCTHKVEEAAGLPSRERSINNSPLAAIPNGEPAVPSVNVNGTNEPFSLSDQEATLTEATESLAADKSCEETTKAVGLHQLSEEDTKEAVGSSTDSMPHFDNDDMEESGSSIEVGFVEADNSTSQALLSDFSDTPAVLNSSLSIDESIAALELPGGNIDSSYSKEVVKEGPHVLQNILQLPVPATVDFETSILDVKFSSLENSSAKSSLEALLVDMPESHNEMLCVREDDKSLWSEPIDLVIIQDGDSATSETSNSQLFFSNNYGSCCLPSNAEDQQQDPHNCSNQDLGASLL